MTDTEARAARGVPQRSSADWSTLASHHGYTPVDHIELANETGQRPDSATTATVQVSYNYHQTGRDGWRATSVIRHLGRITLIRTSVAQGQVSGFAHGA